MKKFILALFISLTVLILKGQDQALISNVRKISATQGGFTGQLDEGDQFATAEVIGDIDGNRWRRLFPVESQTTQVTDS